MVADKLSKLQYYGLFGSVSYPYKIALDLALMVKPPF
jgi:hypothetical protein